MAMTELCERRSEGCLDLEYRPPYQWARIFGFLELRAIPGVETVRDGAYFRTVRVAAGQGEDLFGWLSLAPMEGENAARLTVSDSLVAHLPQIAARVRRQFDFGCDPQAVAEGLRDFDQVCPGSFIPGTRLPGSFDAYEMCVRAVLGQQISVKGASTLAGRVASALGVPVETGVEGLAFAFPSARDVASMGDEACAKMESLGIIKRRVATICALAQALEEGGLDLSYGADPERTIADLIALPGVGLWTAHYIAMRATGYTDAFPSTDLGVKKALAPRSQKEIEKTSLAWSPWRAYATMSLWSH